MDINRIYNEDCLTFIPKLEDHSIDIVVTSPPYNTSKKSSQENIQKKREKGKLEAGYRQHHSRYDVFQDQQTDEEYADFIASIFNALEPKLKKNGTIVWNVSYGIGDTGKPNYAVWYSFLSITDKTSFNLVGKSLALYGTPEGLVYDPFIGTGTTAIACIENGMNYIGTELSPNQCKWAEKRIRNFKGNSLWFK